MNGARQDDRLDATLAEITRLLEKHRVLDTLAGREASSRRDLLQQIQHRQNSGELEKRCRALHPADLAELLERLPTDDRLLVWSQAPSPLRAQALVEMSDAGRSALVELIEPDALIDALRHLEADDLAYLEGRIPDETWSVASRGLEVAEQSFLRETVAYPDESVGHLMSRQVTTVRESMRVAEAIADLRRRDELPRLTDRLFVVDARHVLRGVVPLGALLQADPGRGVADLMLTETPIFGPHEPASAAIKAFERYDLVSAPVVDDRGKLLGRLMIDAIMDVARAEADRSVLKQAGLQREEDLFAPVLDSARNRWPWLAVNLLTAFFASRVIGLFEHTIGQLVALATLMPVVASIGGNTGNQTVALVTRAIALGHVRGGMTGRLLRKELTVSVVNGLLWGAVVGLLALLIYRSVPLGLVLLAAVALNLVVAALVGVLVPIGLQRMGRDPAHGSSVLLTFLTDSMGFLLFLGLAEVLLF